MTEMNINEKYLLSRKEWQEALSISKQNPAIMMRVGLNYLTQATNGELDFVDATTPASLLMEFSATLAANNFNYFKSADKQHYPVLADDVNQLYHHMSTELYERRFATPSKATFRIMLLREEIIALAAPIEGSLHREVYIPRGTTIGVDGAVFTFLHAVRIRVSPNDGVDVVYDTTERDETESLESNILEYFFSINIEQKDFLIIDVPLLQVMKVKHSVGLTHKANVLVEHLPFSDQFMKARVYLVNTAGVKREIYTTHSDLVYDKNRLTARLKVLPGNVLRVDIPLAYYDLELVEDEQVYIEIYTTKGDHRTNLLDRIEESNYPFTFSDEFPSGQEYYGKILSTLNVNIFPLTNTSGGTNETPFETIKQWMIDGGREVKDDAITGANLKLNANHLGYDIHTDIDYLTNRLFKASREIKPDTNTSEFERGVSCSIEHVHINPTQFELHPAVNRHKGRMTLTPKALFRTHNGITEIVNESDIPTRQNKTMDQYLAELNNLEYIQSPFYYVLDSTDKIFDMRAYHLDRPRFISKSFIQRNESSNYSVNADLVRITKQDYGYELLITVRSDDAFKEIHYRDLFCQLSFIPKGSVTRAYLNGEFIGWDDKNGVWRFELRTTFDVDKDDYLIFNNFYSHTLEFAPYGSKLEQKFQVILGLYDNEDEENDLDLPINEIASRQFLDGRRQAQVITENGIVLQFGKSLKHLWRNTRDIIGSTSFERYTENVPLRYPNDIFETEANGLAKRITKPDGGFELVVKHRRGTPVMDSQGNPVYIHRKGDIKLDADKRPIQTKPKIIEQILDIFFIDGIYRFSTDESDREYYDNTVDLVVNWVENDIAQLAKNLLEQSEIYFVPKRTMGYVKVIVENGIERTIFNRLSVKVKYYLTAQAYNNHDFRDRLEKETRNVISRALSQRVVSKDIIESELRKIGAEGYIHGVNILDLGLGRDINTFTIIDEDGSCSIKRKLIQQPNNTLKIKEDLEIEYVNHTQGIKIK